MVSSSARRKRPPRSASAKLVPSAEMPKPENIRRIVTGPKPENRSIRKSRSMAGSGSYDVILRCEPPSASLEGWPQVLSQQPSFEARKRERAPQDDAECGKKLA